MLTAGVVPRRRTSRDGIVVAGCVIDTIVNKRTAVVVAAVGLGRRWACPCQWEWGSLRSLGARCTIVVSQAATLMME